MCQVYRYSPLHTRLGKQVLNNIQSHYLLQFGTSDLRLTSLIFGLEMVCCNVQDLTRTTISRVTVLWPCQYVFFPVTVSKEIYIHSCLLQLPQGFVCLVGMKCALCLFWRSAVAYCFCCAGSIVLQRFILNRVTYNTPFVGILCKFAYICGNSNAFIVIVVIVLFRTSDAQNRAG